MIGRRILTRERAVDPKIVERFRALSVATISDVMSRHVRRGSPSASYISQRYDGRSRAHRKTRRGDNLFVHKAIGLAQPGDDLLVVNAGGNVTNTIIGEIMASEAQARKGAEIVMTGAIRESGAIGRGMFPIFAAGVTHRRPPGEINVPIKIDCTVVHPGDLMLGDDDGVHIRPAQRS